MHHLTVLGVVLVVLGGVSSHTYHFGKCPDPVPMPEFDMNKLLGVWYAIEKTSTASRCITYNFSSTTEPGQFELHQASQRSVLGKTHGFRSTGVLKVPDTSVAAKMRVRFPLNIAGSAGYTVIATDYNTYAVVYTCQKLTFAHRRSATILSRTKELNGTYIDEIRTKLATFGMDSGLSVISQSDCPVNGTTNEIWRKIGDVVKKGRDAVLDKGVEYLVEAGKRAFNKAISGKEELTEAPAENRLLSTDEDAEFFP